MNPMPPIMEPGEFFMPYPLEVEVGGATVFVVAGRALRAALTRRSRPRGDWTALRSGRQATWTRTFTAEDVEAFARITGDRNPLHFDADFAGATRPGVLIVQGGLTTGLFNALVADGAAGSRLASSCIRSGITRRRSSSATR